MSTAGVVTAARKEAAEAGARMLAAGGTAADAAVATAFALTVTDPANCGIGGYGGYAVISLDGSSPPLQVEFNTAPPFAIEDVNLDLAPRRGGFIYGGLSVSRPSVVAGLRHIHDRFGRLPWADVVAPALKLADEGFVVGPDLARAFAWARREPEAFAPEFWRNFAAEGDLTTAPSRLRQPDLGRTLQAIAQNGADAFNNGPLVDAVVQTVRRAGGVLSARDFADHEVTDFSAAGFSFGEASIYGPRPETTGFGVLVSALAGAGSAQWPADRDQVYVERVAAALRAAWQARSSETRSLIASARAIQHTTHLCAADAEEKLISLTFTHGPLWFGSTLIAPGTGIILNCGANLLVDDKASGRRFAQSNIAPVIAHAGGAVRYALGTPGGYRIPATIMTSLIDVLAAGRPLSEAISRPRVATSVAGQIEVEPALSSIAEGARIIKLEEFYGPASGITVTRAGEMHGTKDPRFEGAVASIDRYGNVTIQ